MKLSAILDDFGDHILAGCRRCGPAAGATRRHNGLARAIADISSAAGFEGRIHDGPIFNFHSGLRPADVWQRNPLHAAGEAIDLTIGARSVHSVDVREEQKRAKYRTQLASHPHLAFTPLAIDLSGEIGRAAADLLARWAKRLAATRVMDGLSPGDARGELTAALARAFTRSITDQARAWASPSLP